MSLTISVCTLKGGAGKSTIAINLATCLHRDGHRALIVDADSQPTCAAWAAVAAESGREGPPVVGIAGASLRRDLEGVARGFDVVVIDAPPRLGREQRAAMLSADLVVMPVTPGPADVWALRETIGLLNEAREYRPELGAVVVLNRIDARTTISSVTRRAVADAGVPILTATLGNRVAFGEATAAGLGVVTYAPKSRAAEEIRAFTSAVLAVIGGEHVQERRAS